MHTNNAQIKGAMNENNSDKLSLSQALELIKNREKESFNIQKINLAELERLTGITRAKLRRLKKTNFKEQPHGLTGRKCSNTVLSGYTGVLDNLLRSNVTNSAVCLERLQEQGFTGGLTSVKNYISTHKDLVPAKRHIVSPQGNRGRRYSTEPGRSFQMDWGFVKVRDCSGYEYLAACFAMICHHCGQRYIEFFPNAKQENLFIGMIHTFVYMGIPKEILTDNMKSIVVKRDFEGNPVWNREYDLFMKAIGFETRLCKPYHPFTKGKVERLVQFVKNNFLSGRTFVNVTDLNEQALEWCNKQNSSYHRAVDMIPTVEHDKECIRNLIAIEKGSCVMEYLCPLRRISFDGFVTYEGRRFGVPFSYTGKTVRVCRIKRLLKIYTPDMKTELAVHDVTWSKKDSCCEGQFESLPVPEEFPTAPVKTVIQQLEELPESNNFDRFDFSGDNDER